MQRTAMRTQAAVKVSAMATQRKSGSAKKGAAPKKSAGNPGRTLWLPNTVRRAACVRSWQLAALRLLAPSERARARAGGPRQPSQHRTLAGPGVAGETARCCARRGR